MQRQLGSTTSLFEFVAVNDIALPVSKRFFGPQLPVCGRLTFAGLSLIVMLVARLPEQPEGNSPATTSILKVI